MQKLNQKSLKINQKLSVFQWFAILVSKKANLEKSFKNLDRSDKNQGFTKREHAKKNKKTCKQRFAIRVWSWRIQNIHKFAPTSLQDASTAPPRPPKILQDGPKMAPRSFQEVQKLPNMPSRSSLDAPKSSLTCLINFKVVQKPCPRAPRPPRPPPRCPRTPTLPRFWG